MTYPKLKSSYSDATRSLLFLSLLISTTSCLLANNIRVTNISLGTNDYTNKTLEVNFDLAWDNSWRTSTLESNWDAAWVILKFKINTSENYSNYSHAKLKANGHTAASGSIIEIANGLQGAIIYRSSDGIGNVTYSGLTLLWDYGSSFISGYEALNIQLIATEMVYIPGGPFYVGDASAHTSGRFADGSGNPFHITSESALTLGGGGSNLNSTNYANDDFDANTTQSLPLEFPKGFDPFYIMKYEMSIDQYLTIIDLNNKYNQSSILYNPGDLQIDEFEDHFSLEPNSFFVYSLLKDGSNVFFNLKYWHNINTVIDWYGLRPMSELEFEKASRGTISPIMNEYVWGDQFISDIPSDFLFYSFDGSDDVDYYGKGNAIFYGTFDINSGPFPDVKVGYFAAEATTKSRQITGSSYYGVQGLSGSAMEPVASVGNQEGRSLQKNFHGDGDLNTAFYDFSNIIGSRGGRYDLGENDLRTSSRLKVNVAPNGVVPFSGRMVISDF